MLRSMCASTSRVCFSVFAPPSCKRFDRYELDARPDREHAAKTADQCSHLRRPLATSAQMRPCSQDYECTSGYASRVHELCHLTVQGTFCACVDARAEAHGKGGHKWRAKCMHIEASQCNQLTWTARTGPDVMTGFSGRSMIRDFHRCLKVTEIEDRWTKGE